MLAEIEFARMSVMHGQRNVNTKYERAQAFNRGIETIAIQCRNFHIQIIASDSRAKIDGTMVPAVSLPSDHMMPKRSQN